MRGRAERAQSIAILWQLQRPSESQRWYDTAYSTRLLFTGADAPFVMRPQTGSPSPPSPDREQLHVEVVFKRLFV